MVPQPGLLAEGEGLASVVLCWAQAQFSLAAVAKLIGIISSEISIAPQVQPGTLG